MDMDEYFVLFREYMLVQKPSSVNTRDSYLRDVSAFLRYLEGENITSPLEVETETVEAYVQHLHSLNRTNSTISRNIASVRCFYKFLILRGDMQVNPAKSVKLEKEPKKLPQTLTSEEIDLLLSQPNVTEAKGCRDKAMLELLYATGIRVSELINLNVQDINLRIVGKGSKERIVYLNDACLASIDAYVRVRPKDDVKDKNALFISNRGTRISPKTVQAMVNKYLTKIGLGGAGYSVHKLRHTAATLMYQYGNVDIRVLQDILGHENLGTTEIYTHTSSKQMEEAVNANPLSKMREKTDKNEK